jgi:F0F1-type ATP synthase membrane subunit c/vacuolar-type H+-ATPase subunit K
MHKTLVSLTSLRTKVALFFAALAAAVVVSGPALAVETKTEEGVKTVATQVSSEGVNIILAILAALVGLLVAIIVIPKAIGLIRRFI